MTRYRRRDYLRSATALGGALVAGCLGDDSDPDGSNAGDDPDDSGSGDDPDDSGPGDDPGDSGSTDDQDEPGDDSESTLETLPSLLVLSDGQTDGGNEFSGSQLSLLVSGEGSEGYALQGSFSPTDGQITDYAALADGYVVAISLGEDSTRLQRLDGEMGPGTARDLQGSHALATDAGTVYTAHDTGFRSFDATLAPVGAATLPDTIAGKYMEAVQVHDGVAYVVDDVRVPKFTFRVDVSDPASPAYLEALETWGINQTLHQQWLVPAENRWCFLQRTTYQTGAEHSVFVTPMQGAPTDGSFEDEDSTVPIRSEEAIRRRQYYSRSRSHEDDAGRDRTGTRIGDVAATPPIFATIDDADGGRHLSSVSIEGDGITFGRELPIDSLGRVDTGPGVAVTVGDGGTVIVFDTAAGAVAHEGTLPLDDPLSVTLSG